MQIKVVGHHGGTDDADGDVDHPGVTDVRDQQRVTELEETRLGLGKNEDVDEVAASDGGDQNQDDGFDGTHAEALQAEQEKHVEPGDDDSPEQGDVKEKIEGDSAAQNFGEIAGADGNFTHQPVGPAGPGGIPVAAALGQVLAGDHAQAGGDDLHEDRHQAGKTYDPEETVFELRTALQVGAPVAGIHVADADQYGGADKGFPLLPETGLIVGNLDGAVDVLQRTMGRRGLVCRMELRGVGDWLVFTAHGWRRGFPDYRC